MTKVVGTNTIGYPEIRNFCGLEIPGYAFVKKQNFNKIPAFLYEKTTGRIHEYYWNSYCDLNLHKVDLFHFFNSISYGKVPWVTTFETSLPRWGSHHAKIKTGLELLAGRPCQKLIALSDCTARIQRGMLDRNYPEYAERIGQKLTVVHPAQKTLIKSIDEKPISDMVILTMVGADFFRKGGKEVLLVLDRLYQNGLVNWELNIISTMRYGDYASFSTKEDLDIVLKLIEKYPDNIRHWPYMENANVLELMKQTNVVLLPTYGDTYGYSVLEGQGAGCPVISTDIRALSEINNDKCGWVIKVPKDELGNGLLVDQKHRETFSNLLMMGLEDSISEVLNNPAVTLQKGAAALQRIHDHHSLQSRAIVLKGIYDEVTESALGS